MAQNEKERIIDYLYDELTPVERASFERSMRQDEALAAHVESLRGTRELVRRVAGDPPAAPSALLSRLQREARLAVSADPVPSLWDRIGALLWRPATGFAVVVAAVVATGLWVRQNGPKPGPALPSANSVAMATEDDRAAAESAPSMHATRIDPSDLVRAPASAAPAAPGVSPKSAMPVAVPEEKPNEVAAVPIPSPSPDIAAAEKPALNAPEIAGAAAAESLTWDAERGLGADKTSRRAPVAQKKKVATTTLETALAPSQRARGGYGDATGAAARAKDVAQAEREEVTTRKVAEPAPDRPADLLIPVTLGDLRNGEPPTPADPRLMNTGAPPPSQAATLGGASLAANQDGPTRPPSAPARAVAPAATDAPPAEVVLDTAPQAAAPALAEAQTVAPRRDAAEDKGDAVSQEGVAHGLEAGEAYYRAQRYDQAIRELESYLGDKSEREKNAKAGPSDADARRQLAESYERTNRLEQAAAQYKTLLAGSPGYRYRSAVLVDAAEVEARLGRLEAARALLQQAMADPAIATKAKARLATVEQQLAARQAADAKRKAAEQPTTKAVPVAEPAEPAPGAKSGTSESTPSDGNRTPPK